MEIADVMKEIELLKQINSPYIMKLSDQIYDQDAAIIYLVCEYVTGKELLEVLDEKGALPEADACKILKQVLRGASHMHSQNIVHRDLKLENILVRFDRKDSIEDDSVKIIDLGLGTKI